MNLHNPHDWFRKAERNIGLAQLAVPNMGKYPDLICYHCLQAAEKYLKALVVHHGLPLRKMHDLTALLDMLAPLDATIEGPFYTEALKINEYGIDICYPDPDPDPTPEEVHEALEVAGFFRKFAAGVLAIK